MPALARQGAGGESAPERCGKEPQDGHSCPSIMGSGGECGRTHMFMFCDICDAQDVARFFPLLTDRNLHAALPVSKAGVG